MRRGRLLTAAALLAIGAAAPAAEWPRFRGPGGAGVADGEGIPIRWDVARGENVRWAAPIPGMGHSSPIVWGGRLFVTTAVASGDESSGLDALVLGDEGGIDHARDAARLSWRIYCLDAGSGRTLWQREAFAGEPRAHRHVKASQANPTPATDGKTVVAIFGSQGMAAFDLEGRELWRTDLGRLDPGLFGDPGSEWGYASSPILHGGRVYVQVDRHADSFLAAFDAVSGEPLWRVARDERPVWSTPLLLEGERDELVVAGGHYVRAYDPASGRELWRFHDEAEVKVPSPFAADGLLLLSGGYRGRPMFALRPGGDGDVSLPEGATSGPRVAWKSDPGGPYTSTPVAYRGLLYSVRDEGIFQVHDLATGALLHRERTGATHAASPIASDGHVFVASESGELLVYGAGRTPELLARNDMGEVVMATPAVRAGTLFVRTGAHVYAIAAAGAPTVER